MKKTHECQFCKEKAFKANGEDYWNKNGVYVTIDSNSTNYTCGISGVVDMGNVCLGSGIAKCSECGSEIYSEGR